MSRAADFWHDKRVLITGHTGFKGGWLAAWLNAWGARVTGLSLAPDSTPALWDTIKSLPIESHIGDIRDSDFVAHIVRESKPNIIFHMAAQSLVRRSYEAPIETFATNILGTVYLLQAARALENLGAFVVVTSDKVYENQELGKPFEEGDRLSGRDPYSSSKACAELVTQSMRDSFFADHPRIVTARAGNVIGGGDWSCDRLVPDAIRAHEAGIPLLVRNPKSVRPWQHVLEPVGGYICYAQAVAEGRGDLPLALNFGPDPEAFASVAKVVEAFGSALGGGPKWKQDGRSQPHEAGILKLSSARAGQALGWHPRLSLKESLNWTAEWYRAYYDKRDALALTLEQIERYCRLVSVG